MPSSEVHVLTATDPVAAFVEADRIGVPVALPTSGTSGRPRTVVRTTASWTDSFAAVSELTGTTSGSRVWVPGPVTATMNLFATVHARWAGARLARSLAEATHAHLTPTSLRRLLADGADLAGRSLVVARRAVALLGKLDQSSRLATRDLRPAPLQHHLHVQPLREHLLQRPSRLQLAPLHRRVPLPQRDHDINPQSAQSLLPLVTLSLHRVLSLDH